MDRDVSGKAKEPEFWCGEIKPGVFFTDNINYVRQEWLEEGIVPRANVRGYNKFNSITRHTPGGDCCVKQRPAFHADVREVMADLGVPYQSTGIGKATLQAIEWLMKPRRQETPPVDSEAYLAKQKYTCAPVSYTHLTLPTKRIV